MSDTFITRPDLPAALKQHFGFDAFLEGQEEIMRPLLEGRDVLAIMPTGAGKSLCFQLPALMGEGVSLVVSPLISLMKDQVDALTARGLPAGFLNSSLSSSEQASVLSAMEAGLLRLVYVAPERFRDERFLATLRRSNLRMIAIDEAHCISQWGHDFRPDYVKLKRPVREWSQVPVIALTATATPTVRADIRKQLGLGEGDRKEPVEQVFGFARSNLRIEVDSVSSHKQKQQAVERLLAQHPDGAGIVYCSTTKMVDRVCQKLKGGQHDVVGYHGKLGDEERKRVQEAFAQKRTRLVVATNAFGMGIDRDDVRFVVHWDIPGSIEAYYQEIGRAGRDGKDSTCLLLFNYADVRTQEFFLEGANPPPELVMELWTTLKRSCIHGPVQCSIDDWADQLRHSKNGMAVGTALYLLDRADMIRRLPAERGRGYSYDLHPDADSDRLREQLAGLKDKAGRDREKLDAMLRYVNDRRCRHGFILHYFGEEEQRGCAAMCDRCDAGNRAEGRAPTEDEWLEIQKVLSGIGRMNGRFGKARVAQVLIGSKAKPVVQAGLDQLSTHGILSHRSEGYVKGLIDWLIDEGAARIEVGDYPLVALTDHGKQVMWRKADIVWRPGGEAATAKPGSATAPDAEVDPRLYDALRVWRNQEATRRKVPPYMVLTDKTLRGVAAARPANPEELAQVWGLGEYKLKQFGEGLLEVVGAS